MTMANRSTNHFIFWVKWICSHPLVIMYFITLVLLKFSRFFKTNFRGDLYADVDSQTAVRSNSNHVILHSKWHFFVSNAIWASVCIHSRPRLNLNVLVTLVAMTTNSGWDRKNYHAILELAVRGLPLWRCNKCRSLSQRRILLVLDETLSEDGYGEEDATNDI